MARIDAYIGYAREIEIFHQMQHAHRQHHHPHHRQNAHAMQVPIGMDYGMVAFDMGLPGGRRPASPKYSPPPEAEGGFTHSPQEDDVLVCPNCGDELAMGESEEKQRVWVVKTCGHVS